MSRKFPEDDWGMDNPDKEPNPRLRLKMPWRLDPENGYWAGWHCIRETEIPWSGGWTQLELVSPFKDQMILKIGPRSDWPDTDISSYPKEATLTLYLSRIRWYDCFVDISLNRLADPDRPKFVQFLRGDGFRVPAWSVVYRKDSGGYEDLLSCDPDGDDHRFIAHKGSVAQKLTEIWTPESLESVTDSGDYYIDGTSPSAPVAENGVIRLRLNPYSSSEGMMEYQSFADPTHHYVKVKTAGVWGSWTLR